MVKNALTSVLLPLAERKRRRRNRVHKTLLRGKLSFGQSLNSKRTYKFTNFTVLWQPENGGKVLVKHNSGKVVWETAAGTSFVCAAQAKERFKQSRRYFKIKDITLHECVNQRIKTIQANKSSVEISGSVSNINGSKSTDYIFKLKEVGKNQIHFSLTILDKKYNRTFLTYSSNSNEQFFGFGAQLARVNMKGAFLPLLVTEPGAGRGAEPLSSVMDLIFNAGGDWHHT